MSEALSWKERALQIVSEFFPDAPLSEKMHILWEHTGYPVFWEREHGTPEECLRKQLQELSKTISLHEIA